MAGLKTDIPYGRAVRPEKSALFPLPPDYEELTEEGRRKARVNAVCLQHTPEDMVWAWTFMREHYLLSLPPGLWYQPPVYPSPECHFKFVLDVGKYARNVKVLPRSFAKSTLINELILLWMLGRGPFKVLLIKSREHMVKQSFTALMMQLETNAKIMEDFGELKPARGRGIWSKNQLWLANGFYMAGRPVGGQLLGERPRIWICDDAEFDPALQTCPSDLLDNFRYLCSNHLIPMLDAGCAALLAGTLFSRKSFIYHMAMSDPGEDAGVAYWNRDVYAVADQEGRLSWPEKFPWERLEQLREEIGPSAVAAQYYNEPGEEDARLLQPHPVYCYYTVEDPDEELDRNPLASKATLRTHVRNKTNDKAEVNERPFGEAVKQMYRIVVADPIRKPSSTSDFACAMVIGVERSPEFKDVWWVLDMWMGRVKEDRFLERIWALGRKWQVKLVGIESISSQFHLVDQAQAEFLNRGRGSGWVPRVYPVDYKGDFGHGDRGKPARIAGLSWRFEQGRVRLPKHKLHLSPWRDLMRQIMDATPDLKLLKYDDAVDTLAMAQFVVRTRSGFTGMPEGPSTPVEQLEAGRTYLDGTKLPLEYVVGPQQMTAKAREVLDKKRFKRREREEGRRKTRKRTRLVRRAGKVRRGGFA